MRTPRQILGGELRTCRLNAGLTQADIAHQLGYSSAQFISNWERGVVVPPSNALGKLAQVLGVKPSALINMVCDAREAELRMERQTLLRTVRAARRA